MKLLTDSLKFVFKMCLRKNRKAWKHCKNYDMYWRKFANTKVHEI